jgi:osmotically-inducible protein OsmY
MLTISSPLRPTRGLRPGGSVWQRCLLALCLLAVPGHLRADEMDIQDLQHEVLAYQALKDDPALAKLHLLVKVRKRVATLTGTVPSRALARQAVACLYKLPDLVEVRDAIHVEGEERNAPTVTSHRPSGPTTLPGELNVTLGPMVWKPLPFGKDDRPGKVLPALSPIEPVSRPRELPKKPEAINAAGGIAEAVKDLMVADERYRRLRFEVRQSQVYLSGVVYQWADLHELARVIARLPGVEGVVLQDVRAEPKK